MSAPSLRINARGFRRDVAIPKHPRVAGSCDCHLHVVGPYKRFPLTAGAPLAPPEATLSDYLGVASLVGIDRFIVVQPSFFGTDNRCTLDAVRRMNGAARAIVVLDPAISQEDLVEMHAAGARGVRVNLVSHGGPALEHLPRIVERIRPLGWHVQIFVDSRELPAMAGRLQALEIPLVFDHMAHVEQNADLDDAGFDILCRWLESGVAWAKLSAYRFPASARRARRLVDANASRVVWGSDWPHVVYEHAVPEEGGLLDRLADWVPDPAVRERILVDNPSRLYFQQVTFGA